MFNIVVKQGGGAIKVFIGINTCDVYTLLAIL
jgi:hypothetical protein